MANTTVDEEPAISAQVLFLLGGFGTMALLVLQYFAYFEID